MNAFREPTSRERAADHARQVLITTANAAGYDLADLRRRSKRPHLVEARWQAAAAAYTRTEAPVTEIARILGRHHTTVLNGLRRLGVAR